MQSITNLGKKLTDERGIGGQGRLTISRIDTLQTFYGLVLRKNKCDAAALAKGTQAILQHYSEDVSHENCPTGNDSWCSFNRDAVTGEKNTQTHKKSTSTSCSRSGKTIVQQVG